MEAVNAPMDELGLSTLLGWDDQSSSLSSVHILSDSFSAVYRQFYGDETLSSDDANDVTSCAGNARRMLQVHECFRVGRP